MATVSSWSEWETSLAEGKNPEVLLGLKETNIKDHTTAKVSDSCSSLSVCFDEAEFTFRLLRNPPVSFSEAKSNFCSEPMVTVPQLPFKCLFSPLLIDPAPKTKSCLGFNRIN